MEITSEYLTVAEVAAQLRLTRQTVYRKIRLGELPVVRIGSGPQAPLRIHRDALAALVRES